MIETKVEVSKDLEKALKALRQPKGETTIPLRKLRPLPCRQNVGVAYG